MKIVDKSFPVMDIEEFAHKYGLVLEINERENTGRNLSRYFVSFAHLESKSGAVLRSEYGNGNTKHEAIVDYCKHISGKHLVKGAYSPNRVDILPHTIVVENLSIRPRAWNKV